MESITLIDPASDIRTLPLARTCHSQGWDAASTLAVSSFLGGGLLSVRPALYPQEPGRCVARATFIGLPSHPALSSINRSTHSPGPSLLLSSLTSIP